MVYIQEFAQIYKISPIESIVTGLEYFNNLNEHLNIWNEIHDIHQLKMKRNTLFMTVAFDLKTLMC